MESLIPHFSTEGKKYKPKNVAEFLRSQAGEYEQIISNMLEKMNEILYELSPKSFSSISIDTIFIIAFGLIIPLYTLLFRTSKLTSEVLGLLCFSITITFIVSFLFELYLIFNKDSFLEKHEKDEYFLYPKEPYG
jgi:uncharacterized protein YacL